MSGRRFTALCALLLAMTASGPQARAQANVHASNSRGADFGFERLVASQVMIYAAEGWMAFGSEPRIYGVRTNGPAAGKLREGDVLVAVNGALITTREGALRLARAEPFEPVRLTVRRAGRNLDAVLVPVAVAGVPAPPALPAVPAAPPLAPAAPGGEPLLPVPPLPPIPPSAARRATLDLSYSCGPCSLQLQRDEEIWNFGSRPQITAVTRGGAAARAGLRVGDFIESIDGVSIMSAEGGRRFGAIEPGQRVRLGVRRGGDLLQLVVVPGKPR